MSRKLIEFTALRRSLKLAAIPLVVASLAACTPSLTADVKRFQSQLPAPAGQSFAVVADDPALAGGIEFSQYARLVEAQMVRLGYAPSDPEHATLPPASAIRSGGRGTAIRTSAAIMAGLSAGAVSAGGASAGTIRGSIPGSKATPSTPAGSN